MFTGARGRIAFQLHFHAYALSIQPSLTGDVAVCPANNACWLLHCIQQEIVASKLGVATSNRRQFRDGKQFGCRLIGVPNLARECFDHPSAFHAHRRLEWAHMIGAASPFLFGS